MIQSRAALLLSILCGSSCGYAATITECQDMLRTGKYVECLDAASAAVDRRSYGEEWPILKATAETQLGHYLQAAQTLEAGIARYSWSVRLRMLAYENATTLGDTDRAQLMIQELEQVASAAPWRYTDADDLVALGKAAIVIGVDPKDVLEGFYGRAQRNYKSRPDGFLAAGQLAIDKGDLALASETLRPAAEQFPDNPEICFALATSIQAVEPEKAAELWEHTLTVNPNFAPTQLHLAKKQIDAEDYAAATETISEVHRINPWHPEGHALQAVIHHLKNDPIAEAVSHSRAIAFSPQSPAIDYLIGERLSRKYRFREGAAFQQMALQTDPAFLPAKTQLAQDLLRLGEDERGWKLADEAQKQDKYDTTLFNLMQLKNDLDKFATRTTDQFVIRMRASESAVYGDRVEELLTAAMAELSKKYGYTPSEKVVVEIFDRPDDFAVRTFGLPDVAGFLGVCFGKLVTANSPASQRENPNNWESVLWHEFCHVITLQMTDNKIPRWLSEGISVYEERQKDDRWGQHMSPVFRVRVQRGNVTPVSQLSSAFLNAKSGDDLNFAYYESSMVVEFIVQEHGFDALKAILNDLKTGLTINDALARHTGGLAELDAAFEDYLKSVADNFAKGVRFDASSEDGAEPIQDVEGQEDPKNYTAGLKLAVRYVRAGETDRAIEKLQQLIELFPDDRSPNGARPLLAQIYERQNKTALQMDVLAEHLQYSGDDLESAMKLLALQVKAELWPEAASTGELVAAIDPLQPAAIRNFYTAAMKQHDTATALQALRGLLQLEPADAARTHFQMATLLTEKDPSQARRHVLLALEQAPRYRDAHKLLLKLTAATEPAALQ